MDDVYNSWIVAALSTRLAAMLDDTSQNGRHINVSLILVAINSIHNFTLKFTEYQKHE